MNLFKNQNKSFEEKLSKQLEDLEYKPSELLWDKISSTIPDDGFETAISESVNSYQPNPTNENWNKIESQLQQKNDYRKFYWIPLLFLFSAATAYFGYEINKKNDNSIAVNTISKKQLIKQHDEINMPNLDVEKSDASKLKRKNIIQNIRVKGNTNYSSNSTKKQITQATRNKILLPENSAKKIVPFISISNNKNNHHSFINKKSLTHSDTKYIAVITPSKEIRNSLLNDKKPEPQKEITQQNNSTQIQQTSTVIKEQKFENKIIDSAQNNTSSLLALSNVQPSYDSINLLTQNNIEKKKTTEDKLTKYSITVLTGMHYCFNYLSAPNNSGINFKDNILLRNKLETPSLDWSGAFLLNYSINEKWKISSGIMVSNFTQEFQYAITTPTSIHKGLPEVGTSYTNSNDSIINGNSYNNRIKYTWTEIPLFITYTFKQKGKFGFDLMGGVSYAFITGVDAAYVSYDNVGLLIVKDKNDFPGVKNNFFVHLYPTLTYQVNPLVSLGVAPTFKMSITSITDNENWVQQHPYFVGLSLSLRRKF